MNILKVIGKVSVPLTILPALALAPHSQAACFDCDEYCHGSYRWNSQANSDSKDKEAYAPRISDSSPTNGCSSLPNGHDDSATTHNQSQLPNQTKGQNQLAGAYVKFGEVYSLKTGFNFQILRAYYTLDPVPAYANGAGAVANSDANKVFVIEYAVKNATSSPKGFADPGIQVFDQNGHRFDTIGAALDSDWQMQNDITLNPGQGLGQKELKNTLRAAFNMPYESLVTKIVIPSGRLNRSEDVLRYLMAGTDPSASPLNLARGFAANMADPSSKSGGVPIHPGKGAMNQPLPTAFWRIQVDSISTKLDSANGTAADDGKQFAIVNFTISNPLKKDNPCGAVVAGKIQLLDSDGNSIDPWKVAKTTGLDDADGDTPIPAGGQRKARILFQIPKEAKPTKLMIGAQNGFMWSFDWPTQ